MLRPGGTLVVDTIARTWWGRFSSITVGERLPAGPPRRLHDPALFVDRAELVRLAAQGGVALHLTGLRPSAVDYLAWLAGRRRGGAHAAHPLHRRAVPGRRAQDRPPLRGVAVTSANLTGRGHALPASMDQQALWDGYFREHYADDRVARTVWKRSGITTRRGVVDPTQEDISSWGTGARMQRYLAEALPAGQGGGRRGARRRRARPRRRRPVRGRQLHRLRHPRPRHPARARPRHDRRRAAPAHRPHGLLRGPARARRGRRLHRRPRPAVGAALPRADQPARAARHRRPRAAGRRRRRTSSRWWRTRCSATPPPRSCCSPTPPGSRSSTSPPGPTCPPPTT